MSAHIGPEIVNDNLVFKYDMANTQKSWKGAPTTNYVPSADTMPSWGGYGAGNDGTFITEFGTTGYQMLNRGSWNGIARGITLPSTGTYTFSAWVKYAGGSANNNGGTVYISGWGGGDSAVTTNKSLIGVWQRLSITLNCTTTSVTFYLISYGGTNDGVSDRSTWYVTMPQAEAGTTATPFVAGTRSNTQAILDITGNNTVTANSLTYASDNTFSFNGTSDSLSLVTPPSITNQLTIEGWVKLSPTTASNAWLFGREGSYRVLYSASSFSWICATTNNGWYTAGTAISAGSVTPNTQTYHVVVTYDGSNNRIYVNGTLRTTGSAISGNLLSSSPYVIMQDGSADPGIDNGKGTVYVHKIYNRALSETEVRQNFNAKKDRYLGESSDIPALSGYALKQARPDLPSGYYWIKNHLMPNALRMYVDMTEEGGGYDFYAIEGGTSFSLYSDTHSGTALGLDYVYPRSKNHWRAMSNFVKNTLGYTGTNYTRFFANVGKVYRTGGIGNYTSFPMRDPNYYGTGAPDWRVPDGGRWWLRDTAYGEPNGNYTLGGFLYFWQGHMLENYDLRDLLFDDAAAPPTGTYYLVSTNAKP
jgi:hypothetical protein